MSQCCLGNRAALRDLFNAGLPQTLQFIYLFFLSVSWKDKKAKHKMRYAAFTGLPNFGIGRQRAQENKPLSFLPTDAFASERDLQEVKRGGGD